MRPSAASGSRDLPLEARIRFVDAIVRVDIPTRLVKVTSPKWEVAKLRRDGSRPSSGYSAEFIDASVLIKAHIFSLEWIMTNMLTWSLWDKYYST